MGKTLFKLKLKNYHLLLLCTAILVVVIIGTIMLTTNLKLGPIDYKKEYNLDSAYEMIKNENFSVTVLGAKDDKKTSDYTIRYRNNRDTDINMVLLDASYNFENQSFNDFAIDYIKKQVYYNYENANIIYQDENNIVYSIKNNFENDIETDDEYYIEANYEEYCDYFITERDNIFIIFYADGSIKNQDEDMQFILYIIDNAIINNKADLSEYIEIANEDSSHRAYNDLKEIEKKKYDEIYECLIVNGERFQPEDGDEEGRDEVEYFNAFEALRYDIVNLDLENYDLYEDRETGEFVADYYNNVILPCRGNGTYSGKWDIENYELTEDELIKFNNTVKEIVENMPESLSTYGKYKYLAECICNIAEYDIEGMEEADALEDKYYKGLISAEEKYDNTNWRLNSTVSVFADGKSICGGYAKAYLYLCEKVGLYCEVTTDTYREHAYNLIKLGNKIYFTDVTWMDSGIDEQFAYTYEEAFKNGHEKLTREKDEYEMDWRGNKINTLGTIEWNDIKHFNFWDT
ncbi:MAG: hypothetical protein IKP28_00555 [Clostridia bacterium]|nr:hypothetical protein [Clostridia bacterium]